MRPRVKICCISSLEEAHMAIHFGASALGLVANMPSGPGIISDEEIKYIASHIPPVVSTFMLTSFTDGDDIISQHTKTLTQTIQIVDTVLPYTYAAVKSKIPAVKLVQVIHVTDEKSLDEALRIAPHVDALLLDSGNPNLSVKVLGGTGKVHNWVISRKIVEQSPVPVFLAGGLNATNVRKAIEEVNPFGLDLCSGVRTDKKLDPYKLESFFNEVWKS